MSGNNVFEVKWSIQNIEFWLQETADTLYSPQFLAKPLANTRWKLMLSTNLHLNEKYICLTLQRDIENDGPDLIFLNCELSFLASDGSSIYSKARTVKFSSKTVSHELNVKHIDILDGRKEEYLQEGVLTVCCKMRKCMVSSMVSKGEECLIRSAIGTKCITSDSTIDNFNKINFDTNVLVKFLSLSTEISLIIYFYMQRNKFMQSASDYIQLQRIKVDCKCFRIYSCKLFAVDGSGKRRDIFGSCNLLSLLNSNEECEVTSYDNKGGITGSSILKGDSLQLRLEIIYSPAVQLEHIEYKFKNCEELLSVDQSIKHLSTSFSGDLQTSEQEKKLCDAEDFYFDASKRGNVLQTTLQQDLSSLFKDRLFCDTKLRTDVETFPAHRCVLSARSPVFKKMFTTDMKEIAGEYVNVPDISSDTVRRMLQFLYTDGTGDLDMQSAKDLYIASDKYDIASLKECCSSYMKKNLCPANVCNVLVLADMHQDKDLESFAHEYVLSNNEEVFYSDEWKLFMKNYSALAANVMYLKCTKK